MIYGYAFEGNEESGVGNFESLEECRVEAQQAANDWDRNVVIYEGHFINPDEWVYLSVDDILDKACIACCDETSWEDPDFDIEKSRLSEAQKELDEFMHQWVAKYVNCSSYTFFDREIETVEPEKQEEKTDEG